MKKVRLILATLLALIASGFSEKGVWIIDAKSRLTIHGSTNVNKFICKIEYCTGTDTLQYVESRSTRELHFTRSRMTVPIKSFDCGAKPISKDFWTTLKSDTYPTLEINFISLQNVYFKDNKEITGVVDITLAGVTTRYTVCYDVTAERNGEVLLQGAHAVNFSDFNLEAPEKLKGLIKVKEVLNVQFDLVLREI